MPLRPKTTAGQKTTAASRPRNDSPLSFSATHIYPTTPILVSTRSLPLPVLTPLRRGRDSTDLFPLDAANKEVSSNSRILTLLSGQPTSEQNQSSQEQIHPSQEQIHPSQDQIHPSQEQIHPSQEQIHPSQEQIHPSQEQIHPSQ